MFGFEYRLILSMLYIWFQVPFGTKYVLFIMSRNRLILDMFDVTFHGYRFGSPYRYWLHSSRYHDKCI